VAGPSKCALGCQDFPCTISKRDDRQHKWRTALSARRLDDRSTRRGIILIRLELKLSKRGRRRLPRYKPRLRPTAWPVIFDMMNRDLATPLTPGEWAALRGVAQGWVISEANRQRLMDLGLIAEQLGRLEITDAGRMRLAADR